MMSTRDKRIAAWLNVSIATFYRWRKAGLLPRRPQTPDEAREMRRRIDEARDDALNARHDSQQGRTPLHSVAKTLGARQ